MTIYVVVEKSRGGSRPVTAYRFKSMAEIESFRLDYQTNKNDHHRPTYDVVPIELVEE